MKQILLLITFVFACVNINAQLSLVDGVDTYSITFDQSQANVNNGVFAGTGLVPSPANGQLDGDAWAITGMSSGTHNFGATSISNDFARGQSNGGSGTGGLYSFEVATNNYALGVQPTGGDWTPGAICLKVDNDKLNAVDEVTIDFKVYIYNDQNRANSFDFAYSIDNVNFIDLPNASITSPGSSDSNPSWIANDMQVQIENLGLNPNQSLFLKWTGADQSGSGSRDEFAVDDISITTVTASNSCMEPTQQASNLTFSNITDNSISSSFTAGNADSYLIFISEGVPFNGSISDGITYNVGDIVGNGEVIEYSSSTSFNTSGLQSSTSYHFTIFGANHICDGGPEYNTTNPLVGNESTLVDPNTSYYSVVNNQTCEALKTVLHDLIDDHTVSSYSSLWTIYFNTDDRLNDSGNETIVWDMYSDNPIGAENEFSLGSEQCGNFSQEGDCYNREHTFPRSWWGGSTSQPQYSDIFTVIPVDGWINSLRNNFPYGEVLPGGAVQTTANGSELGSSAITIPGYSGNVFEPIDEYKGDLARAYFYMITRYEDVIAAWENNTSESDAVLDGMTYPGMEQWALDMFISWHNMDPVSQKELDRNNDIFTYQNNRNPFIDHPEYVDLIWGSCSSSDTEAPTIPTNLVSSNVTTSTVNLSWANSTDNVGVAGYNVFQDGALIASVSSTSYLVSNLNSSTTYLFNVSAYDAAGNNSGLSSTISVTTSSPADTQAPSTPLNVTVSNVTETSADLAWDASTDNVAVVGYDIYQDGSVIASSNSTSFSVSNLMPATTYLFNVSAYDAAGNTSGLSSTISVTTASGGANDVILHEGFFETGWDNWSDGGNDAARYSGFRSSEGNYSIRLRDNSGVSSSMTSESFDLSSHSSVEITFSFYVHSFEGTENFLLRYYDGSSWITIRDYVRGIDFNNRQYLTGSVLIDDTNYNFPSNAQFRFQADASGNNDHVYIDAVVIIADPSNSSLKVNEDAFLTSIELQEEHVLEESVTEIEMEETNWNIYPNPSTDYLWIDFKHTVQIKELSIFNNIGMKVYSELLTETDKLGVNVSQFERGIYFIRCELINGETMTKTIIKK